MAGKEKSRADGIIWDLPIRLFHWLLALAVVASFVSIEFENMFVHEKAGLTIIGLLAFRLVWGIVGSRHARFANFLVRPQKVIDYIWRRLEGDRKFHPGHAPTGGYATMAILLAMMVMAGLGLMSKGDVLYQAPLAEWAGSFSKTATSWHHRGEDLIFAIVILHVAAIGFYWFVLKQKLIPPMVTGGHDPKTVSTGRIRQIVGVVLLVGFVLTAHVLGYDANRFY